MLILGKLWGTKGSNRCAIFLNVRKKHVFLGIYPVLQILTLLRLILAYGCMVIPTRLHLNDMNKEVAMKRFFYITFILGLLALASPTRAQVSFSINIGSQPLWGPVGYDYVRYYYLPEMDVYYDVVHRRYTYYHGNRWVTRASLPGRFARVDLYRTHKIVLNHAHPWKNHKKIRKQYSHYAFHHHPQKVLRDYHRADYRRDGDYRHNKKYSKKYRNDKRRHRGYDRDDD